MTSEIKVGILGASGYGGNELVKILANHNKTKIEFVQSKSSVGKKVGELYPDSKSTSGSELIYSDPSIDEINKMKLDVIFLALPKEEAGIIGPKLNAVVIDLSPAQRFNSEYVYGLPEANFEKISKAKKIANPGCYATACILGILPVAESNGITAIAFDCKSGYSGGGKTNKYDYDENVIPYGLGLNEHYQKPEIGKFVSKPFSFTPHVVDAFRGLIATIHVFGSTPDNLEQLYEKFYAKKPFVKISKETPTFNSAKNTPYCVVGGFAKAKDHTIIVSAIDNLLKGAASQAVENMNIRFGFKQTEGLA